MMTTTETKVPRLTVETKTDDEDLERATIVYLMERLAAEDNQDR